MTASILTLLAVRSVLVQTSRVLESLTAAVGMQSFFLAIDLRDDTDPGFLGGSSNGREFWRRLRGGGDTGAKAFKQFCHNSNPSHAETENGPELTSAIVAPAPSASKKNSQTVKAELYDSVRRALQSVDLDLPFVSLACADRLRMLTERPVGCATQR